VGKDSRPEAAGLANRPPRDARVVAEAQLRDILRIGVRAEA